MLSGELDWVRAYLVKAALALGVVDGDNAFLRERGSRASRLLAALECEQLFAFDAALVAAARTLPATGWGALARVIQTDQPIDDAAACVDVAYLQHLDDVAAAPARALAAQLMPLITVAGDVVDLGGGLGTFGATIAESLARACVLVDRAAVVAMHRARARDRSTALAADLLSDPLPTAAAVTVLSNVLHLYGAADAQHLLARAATATARGGHVVVRDLYVADDRRSPRRGVMFALNMALYSTAGDVYTLDQIATWMRALDLTVTVKIDGDFATWIGQRA